MFVSGASWALCSLAFTAVAASLPTKPEGVTIVESTKFPGVSISFKETSICETTKGVKGYSGYVNLPPNPAENRNYESHMYFWFFEARKDAKNAPLTLWLQGGPGVPSSSASLYENGPCMVLENSKTTELSPWSWNDKVNVLYVDQPTQVGYSYDKLVNGTLDVVTSPFQFKQADFSKTGVPETNLTHLVGTFPSQNPAGAPNTTMAAAPVMWHFMQAWMQEFPMYKPHNNRYSLWGESYFGHYGPIFADYFAKQNDKIANGSLKGSAVELHLDTLGLVNTCIDIDTQMIYYPEFAYNNTYGLKLINDTQYESAVAASPMCKNMTASCRKLAAEKDPLGLGNQKDVNEACNNAFKFCFSKIHAAFDKSGRNKFDITAPALPLIDPPKYAAGYLNDAEVQQALGVPLNWTGMSTSNAIGFDATGDFILGDGLKKIGNLLDRGVKVAMMYGDRDYQCNWYGGEAVSLAIESRLSAGFKKAGYANIQTNASYIGGLVRQHGNLTFARVFQAEHGAPYSQPETTYQIFNRVMFNTDVATGKESCTASYSSKGLSTAWSKSEVPTEHKAAKCYLWDVFETCTKSEQAVLRSGKAVVKDWILVGQANATAN